ncbi:diaminopimelate epimerase [Cetobacterium somerae]
MGLKQLEFVKLNPAGNVTILYQMQNIDKKDIQKISKISMNKLNLYAEQVGFVNETHLQMMGGEFCGNACRSFASYLAFNDEKFEKEKIYTITCSGEKSTLEINVRSLEVKKFFLAKIKMPKNLSIKMINLGKYKIYNICEVIFSGIVHFVIEESINTEVIEEIRKYCNEKNYLDFGVMFLDLGRLYMVPYVEIQGFEGVWENSCGSGTTAVGYYLKKYKNIDFAKIVQPGGWLEVSFIEENIFIDGPVEIIAEGISYMDL